jgi:hypothetical protein
VPVRLIPSRREYRTWSVAAMRDSVRDAGFPLGEARRLEVS